MSRDVQGRIVLQLYMYSKARRFLCLTQSRQAHKACLGAFLGDLCAIARRLNRQNVLSVYLRL